MGAVAEQVLTTVVCLALFAAAGVAVLRRMRVSRLHGLPHVPGDRRVTRDDGDGDGDAGGDGDGGDA